MDYTITRPPCEDCYGGVVPPPFVWPALEFKVFAEWGNDPSQTEESVFYSVAKRDWGLVGKDAVAFRAAVVRSMEANLYMETVGVFDHAVTQGIIRPSASFMNRNSLAGLATMGEDGDCNAQHGVRLPSRSTSPQWGPGRFRFAPCAYDAPPWGVRVVPDA